MRKISVAIPNYNRFEMLLQSFNSILNDERVGEIVVSDDESDMYIFQKVKEAVKDEPKIKLFRNLTNRDCFQNKMVAMSLATNDFCILLDSDNVIDGDYLDRLYEFEEWNPKVIYAPDFAKPTFRYTDFSGLTITKGNVASFMHRKMFNTLLNTANFFVNRNEFLRIWDGSKDPVTADSIWFNYCWLAAGNEILVVDNLRYFHRIHEKSHYILNQHRANGFHEYVENKLKALQ